MSFTNTEPQNHQSENTMKMKLYHGDCLEKMKLIPDKSVDMVLTDPPYGTTACKWDLVIPFEPMWEQLKRIIKDNNAIVLFGCQPFTSSLIMSNSKDFKYEWIWKKSRATGHLNSKKMPMRQHESLLVFGKNKLNYFPQMSIKDKPRSAQKSVKAKGAYGNLEEGVFRAVSESLGYPTTVLQFNDAYHDRESGLHPTQKPVTLLEYLIKTYTLENETVLDFTMGSGSTGVACKNLGRKFIGIEKDEKYFEIAKKRIKEA